MNSKERGEYVKYRIEIARKTFDAAKILGENGFYNSAINRLYYAAYYAVNALLVRNNINAQTHSGLKNQFSLHFIKTKKIETKFGQLFSELFDWRQKGDYGNMFDFDEETVNGLYEPVKEFIKVIEEIL